jgi:hypothetical protein
VEIRYYLDPFSGEPHIFRHAVAQEEGTDILEAPGEGRPGRQGTRVAIVQTSAGRYLRVIYIPDQDVTVLS